MTSPVRILVVEDEAILAEDLRESLERLSYTVVDTVDNATDAHDRTATQHPDIVMMDIHLANGDDGITTAAKLREAFDLPVIFLTAHSDAATLDRAKRTSPYGYLVKPFEDQELRASIETALYRHQSDAQLRKMERWLRTTLHSIGDGVITVDLDRRITFINSVAESITGWSRQAAIGHPYQPVFALRDTQHQRIADPIAPVLEHGESLHFDESYQIDTKTGGRCRINDSIAPIRSDSGSITGAIIIFRDATEQWESDQRRHEAERRMQESQRLESLGVLSSGIAHDFNNLLAIILGNAEIVASAPTLDHDSIEGLNQIREAVRRAASLCDQMLTYSDSGQLKHEPVSLDKLAHTTVALLAVRLPPAVSLKTVTPPGPLYCLGHFGRLQQLATNLIINASEAMGNQAGTIEIGARRTNVLPAKMRIRPAAETSPDGWIVLSVEDEGCGMDAATIERIFDPFFSTKFVGRGLGMAIVFNVLQQHGGGLTVTSEPHVGTRFEIYLPATQPKHHQADPSPTIPSSQMPKSGRILIIDDEASVRQVVASQVKHFGFETTDTEDTEYALTIIQTDPSIIGVLLDLTMPNIGGVELLGQIRAVRRSLPVLLISGFSRESIAAIIKEDSHTSFLQKPFTEDDLGLAMTRVMTNPIGS